MTLPTGNIRKLSYPLSFTEDIESKVGNQVIQNIDLSAWSNVDPDIPVPIILSLSLNEYVALASTIDVGRDIAYGKESIFIWWLWVRSLESMTICQAVLDCINNTVEIQQAIASYSLSSAIDSQTGENPTILSTDIFGDQSPCANDNIYGMTVQLAGFLNQTSEDVLEIIVIGLANAGRLGDIIEAIPVVGSLPFDDILQFAEKMAVQVNNAYQGAYDIQLAEDISCDLFCIAQDTCSLTLEQARDYFKSKILVALSDANWATIANDIIANNWVGEQSVYMIHWMILDSIIFGGEILGIDVNRVVQTIASYFNDPNADWQTLCSCSVPFAYERDFTLSNGGWQSDPRDGTGWGGSWNSTNGWNAPLSLAAFENTAIGTAFNATLVTIVAEPLKTLSVGFYNSAGYPNNVDNVFITTDALGNGSAVVNWNILASYLPFIQRNGAASYRQCTYLKIEGFTS